MSIINRNPILKKARINERHGADIASAATVNLTMATGNLVDVTGATTITAITLPDGAERVVRFTGALTLTHGASLVLPGAANITTAAGDFAVFRGYASGVVRCVGYSRASGESVLPSGLVFLSSVSAAGSATLDLETTIDATYENYLIVANNLVVVNNGVAINMRVKVGGSYLAASYNWHNVIPASGAATYVGEIPGGTTEVQVVNDVGNAAGRSASFQVNIYKPSETSLEKLFDWTGVAINSAGATQMAAGIGKNSNTGAITGVRFLASSGNITSGTIKLYGMKK